MKIIYIYHRLRTIAIFQDSNFPYISKPISSKKYFHWRHFISNKEFNKKHVDFSIFLNV